jgi:mRNA-degrading endonuclease RelE of RelBE toxin-antitoxin system
MPAWKVIAHESAERELTKGVPDNIEDDLRQIVAEAAELEEPSSHSDVSILRDENGLFRLKAGKYRALADLEPPYLRILKVEHREKCYQSKALTEAKERGEVS